MRPGTFLIPVLLGLRWPSGKVSALGPEGSRLETRFHGRSVVYGACYTLNHAKGANHLPVDVVPITHVHCLTHFRVHKDARVVI
ncbi:hypothetical protein AVEN_81899-1 [Araneus ventricosus]|uniref:Secreted protein n=1 Tax=Araneus ventricosus TaxID=182803 RepID=A0A4Y2I433_ARAVE|nr:hypothetical protein AVEN_81899-1 [Araneus ventricosus]